MRFIRDHAKELEVDSENYSLWGGSAGARLCSYVTYLGSGFIKPGKVVSQGQREVDEGFQPEIKPLSVNVADYDVVAIGTPTWWYTMAPAVLTFLNANDWSQKTVIPFMTHGGWPGHVIKDIQNSCVGAKFLPDMKIQFDSQGGSNMLTSQADINAWIERVTKAI